MSKPHALIVDDEPDIRELLEITLARMNLATTSANNLEQAFAALEAESFDLCLTDMRLPDGNGIELIRRLQQIAPGMPVAMLTAHGNMNSAIEALKAGAFDFVSKPVDLQTLRNLVTTALRLGTRQVTRSRRLIGETATIEETRITIAKLSRSQAPVYITGESGTGKELAAVMIHEQGPRGDGPFVPVNCGAIPEDLFESELFGHKKGSFTGAYGDKEGLFRAADGGTLFLDEVADLPKQMQVKLLRAIQEKAIRPVGAEQEARVDARILSASHVDIGALIEDGQFRQDLYYRLNVIELRVPSLRDRIDDIPLLAGHILDRLAEQATIEKPVISPDAMKQLLAYSFPGNVRELENILERATTLCEGGVIEADALGISSSAAHHGEVVVGAGGDLETILENVERQTIINALKQQRWNKTAAARALGISFGALRYRMQKLGLD